jgi:hypothetical protein
LDALNPKGIKFQRDSIPISAFLFAFTECLQNNGLLHEIFMVHVMGISQGCLGVSGSEP